LKILDIPNAMAQLVTDVAFTSTTPIMMEGLTRKNFFPTSTQEETALCMGGSTVPDSSTTTAFSGLVCGTNFIASPSTFGSLSPDDGPGFRHASAHLSRVIIGLMWATNGLVDA